MATQNIARAKNAATGEDKDEKDAAATKQPSTLEWMLAVVGCALVVGVIGYMVYRGTGANSAPPQFIFKIEEVVQRGNNDFLVRFSVRNRGEQTAAQVAVEGTLKNGDATLETSSATLDYVPADSERTGGLIFTYDPRAAQFAIRATGYQQP